MRQEFILDRMGQGIEFRIEGWVKVNLPFHRPSMIQSTYAVKCISPGTQIPNQLPRTVRR